MRLRASRVTAAVAVLSAAPGVTWGQAASGEGACAALGRLQVPGVVLSDVTAQWLPAGAPPPPEPPWVPPLANPLPAY
jgi:hypothetical protein